MARIFINLLFLLKVLLTLVLKLHDLFWIICDTYEDRKTTINNKVREIEQKLVHSPVK